MRILVTGGAGFIGSSFLRYLLAEGSLGSAVEILNLDKLTYAGNLNNLRDLESDRRYGFVRGDICDAGQVESAFALLDGDVQAVVNFAAESHVDRSITDSSVFLRTNVIGTQVLLEAARHHGVGKFIQISTDEVYGSLGPEGAFREDSPISPNSPYSASKASADLLVQAYGRTYGLPVCITRCSNNYGPRQFPEKLIPLSIANALADQPLPVYGDGRHIRDWIHVEDHCRGVAAVLRHGRPGEIYNFGGDAETANLDVVRSILRILGKPEALIEFVADRPGHDRRYAVDTEKARRELGWAPQWRFVRGLEDTVNWYRTNEDWVGQVKSGAYQDYYRKMYDNRQAWIREVRKT